ncbi:na+/H+ antiporter family protein [Clostridium argentinense CDC 2741]|uniref:Na+/H+ antiporter family protein n=1 Tax=Clostridium argentinense CDC 2741 TaxID=1418104 RepID=A0A0C1UC38_9CLOT|nr:Na+/H+ antiporter NhaC family protein [Clostridium argentinense]KIE45115.1 na+/H+ antiporter family protein [Clostridium argentinense CDC 2741]
MTFLSGIMKLSPIAVLVGLMMGGMDVLIAAPLATCWAAIMAYVTEKIKFNEIVDCSVENVKSMQLVFFILMFAYAMAAAFMATGVGAAIVNVALKLGLTARTVAVTGFAVTGILSIATGTSWGTFAACAPIFLWLSHIVGGDILVTVAAIAGGACFGDNIGLISDTTVVSSEIQKVEIIDRIKRQVGWAGLCFVLGAIGFYILSVVLNLPNDSTVNAASAIDAIPKEVWATLGQERPAAVDLLNQVKNGVPVYMVIPLILVIIAAAKGISTLACLSIGIISSFILGSFAGTTALPEFLELVKGGFSEAGQSVIVMMMWVGAFGGIMAKMKAFEPISKLVVRISRNVRQLMFWNGCLSILGNALLADEMAQIVTIGPIIKELVDDNVEGSEEAIYQLKIRNSIFSSSLGVFGSQLIPWHVYLSFYVAISNAVYPLYTFTPFSFIKYNIMAVVTVVSLLLLTLTGLDRLIPKFGLPREPEVRLKKKTNIKYDDKSCDEPMRASS